MYRYIPDEIDKQRAHHQAVQQGADDVPSKRIGNLGELAFEQFCREYLPVEMWTWKNEDAMRRCNPESFSSYDFEVFGYEVDVKTSRDVSAFLPKALLENDPDDDIAVMVWHRDNEDSLMLLGWERLETLHSKVAAQKDYSGAEPEKLDHLPARPMNELIDLGPNTAHINQKPENPYRPGDRVIKADDSTASVAIVVEVLPPEKEVGVYGQTMDGEAVSVAFPNSLDKGPDDWRDIPPALLSSYCEDQGVKLYTYKHTNLDFAANPFTPGDTVVKRSHDDPDTAVVVICSTTGATDEISVAYTSRFDGKGILPTEYEAYCADEGVKLYSYDPDELAFV